MLNQHDDHSSFNPANQSESGLPSWDNIMDKLTPEENEAIYNELYDRQGPMRNLKALQKQVDTLQKKLENLNIITWGKTESEYNAKFSEIYNKKVNIESQIRTIILNTK